MVVISTSIKPMNGNVVLWWDRKEEEELLSGIVIPGSKKRDEFAVVIAVNSKSDLKVGDKVVFDKLKGDFTKDGINDVLIISEDDIFGVLED